MNRLTITLIAAGSLIAGFAGGYSVSPKNRYEVITHPNNWNRARKIDYATGRYFDS
jgi:hypothetical protein